MALGWIIRILAILLMVRLVLQFVGGLMRGLSGRSSTGQAKSPQARMGGKLVRDPQCGTHIPETRALRLGRGDQVLFFCSQDCRDRWTAAHPA